MLKCLLGASYRAATSTDLPWQETRLASERTSGLRVPRRTIVRASPVDNSSPASGEKSLSLPRPVQLHGAMAREWSASSLSRSAEHAPYAGQQRIAERGTHNWLITTLVYPFVP